PMDLFEPMLDHARGARFAEAREAARTLLEGAALDLASAPPVGALDLLADDAPLSPDDRLFALIAARYQERQREVLPLLTGPLGVAPAALGRFGPAVRPAGPPPVGAVPSQDRWSYNFLGGAVIFHETKTGEIVRLEFSGGGAPEPTISQW